MKSETPNASHATPHFWREMQYEIRRRTFGKSTSTPTESRHTTCLLGGKSLSVKLMSRRENKELAKTNLKSMGRTMQELQHIGSIALLFSPALSARVAKIFPFRGLNSPSESFPSVQHVLGLITVFDAILTSRQTREKLQRLYENLMSNNFCRTAVLKKNMICKQKLHS